MNQVGNKEEATDLISLLVEKLLISPTVISVAKMVQIKHKRQSGGYKHPVNIGGSSLKSAGKSEIELYPGVKALPEILN